MIKIPPFDVTKQFELIGEELNKTVTAVLASGHYVGGEHVTQFETEFAQYIGTEFGVACNSGTDALYLALRSLDIGAGDEVITTPFTFFSSAEVIDMVGAKPVFVDIEAHSFNIDLALVEQAITERTRAILPVHLFGRPVDMTQLMAIARKHSLYVIEDCAQATGATWADRKVGSIGDIGCFSYYPTKNLGCCGDGGLVTTKDAAIAQKIRVLREHGSPQRYYHDYIGMNSRLDAIQAAILRVKLPYLDKWNFLRKAIADRYQQSLQYLEGIVLPADCAGSVWNQYTIQICNRDRNAIQAKLKELGVISMIYYPLPLHLQKVYDYLGHGKGSFPVTEAVSDRVLSLPMFPELSDEQQDIVVDALKQCLI
ncbi:DegT/DnrJ/EryC1/StrS family aminotransferase [Tumidithrix elongata RA019]|uniref:DegT/DnrJ/EryC1/StrS family aminotransferase n=1 Tax=Tumidithrix elongata BACA0141 TaxID=2716417 RepID=A0AAW9PSH5_9CYAN|nr:DegT/DnrJ/EryC1/StrS family aminotransferase [Tumidithrix elongata RA019]